MHTITLHLGLDVHKDSIAIAEDGPQREVCLFGTITYYLHLLEKALSRIRNDAGERPPPTSEIASDRQNRP